MSEVRIDKWLWAARIYKTRSIATQACKIGRVFVEGVEAKPARLIREGDVVQVRKSPITYHFQVLKPIQNRVGAKLVSEVYKNVTPAEEYELLEMNRISGFINRNRGMGRPTKKERRQLDDFLDPYAHLENFDFDSLDEPEEK